METRKKILEQVLNIINDYFQYYTTLVEEIKYPVYYDAHGLCHLIEKKTYENYFYNDEKIDLYYHDILKDIQNVNNIYFKNDEHYKPFCKFPREEITTLYFLKLWYEKRIKAVQKTIEYYDNKIKQITFCKMILESVLNTIYFYIDNDNELNPGSGRIMGLCSIISTVSKLMIFKIQIEHFIPLDLYDWDEPNNITYKDKIMKDIQQVNNIVFEKGQYYKPFYDKYCQNIKTEDEVKEWYKKRIEVVQKTIEYYNTLLT
jgi:hypothetical protein